MKCLAILITASTLFFASFLLVQDLTKKVQQDWAVYGGSCENPQVTS
jgi:hypothetical protein